MYEVWGPGDDAPKTVTPSGYKYHRTKGITPVTKARLGDQFDKIAEKWEGAFGDTAERMFAKDLAALLALLPGEKGAKGADWRDVSQDWEQYLKAAGDDWRDAFVPIIEGVIEEQGETWNAAFGVQFNVKNLFAMQWFSDYTLKFAQPIMDTTKGDISDMLQQAMTEGWDIPLMKDHLSDIFQQYMQGDLTKEAFDWFDRRMPDYRRENIARTETIRASNAGSFKLFGAWGAPMKEWLATGDGRTRDSHMLAWQQYSVGGDIGPIPMDQPFIVGGVAMMYPGDPDGTPAEFCNCRCSLLPYDPAWEELDMMVGEAIGEGGGAGAVGTASWAPAMSRERAEAWVADSTYKQSVYHTTLIDNVAGITGEGFDINRRKFGKMWGDGVYVGAEKSVAEQYQEWSGGKKAAEILEIKINVQNVLEVDASKADGPRTKTDVAEMAGVKDRYYELSDEMDSSTALTKALQEKGYDAIHIYEPGFTGTGGNQMVIFDPQRVTVVRDE